MTACIMITLLSPLGALAGADSIAWERTELRIDPYVLTQSARDSFAFRNVSSAAVAVTSIVPTCGCITPIMDQVPIPPGARGEIRFFAQLAGQSGQQRKQLHVRIAGAVPEQWTLSVDICVPPAPTLSAPSITWPRGDRAERSVDIIERASWPDTMLRSLAYHPDRFAARLEDLSDPLDQDAPRLWRLWLRPLGEEPPRGPIDIGIRTMYGMRALRVGVGIVEDVENHH